MKKPNPVRKQAKPAPARLRGWKRWAFPLAAIIVVPSLFFILLETGLRVANYGVPTEFLIKRQVAGATVYTDNRQYGWRFFPPRVARRPADIVLPDKKSTNAFRVFVLGESAAMGDPEPAYGIPRMLEVMLSDRFPSMKFEVVNTAMTGISSHVIREIANDCAKFQPDCFVIYMGNNEAIGPYGPGTVFAAFSRYLALTRLSIVVRSLKTSQLVEGLIGLQSKSEVPDGWGGLRVFMKNQLHPSDDRVSLLGEHFESNLKAICETGRKAGAKVVLCTVASNLEDCSPFASMNAPSLSVDQKNAWDAAWKMASDLESGGKSEEALKSYQQAETIDASHAELHFRKATLHAARRSNPEARESFIRARDNDSLRFRTSTDLNARIKRLAQTFPQADTAFADVVETVEKESGASGVGSGHFVDHVHFNFHGNYVVAREIFSAVSRFVPGAARNGATNQATVLTEQECAAQLAFTRWNNMRITEYMLKRFEIPPFNSKSDSVQRVQEFQAKIGQLKDAGSRAAVEEAVAVYRKALQRKKSDPDLLRNLAVLHSELNQPAEEIKYHQALYELFPYDQDRKAFLAEAYARSGNHADGQKLAEEVLKVDPAHVIARLALGTALHSKGALNAALSEYKEVLRLRPDMAEVQQRVEELMRRGDRSFGGAYAESTAPQPGESGRHFQLGQTLLQQGRTEEGLKELRTAVRLEPTLVDAQIALAGALVQQGKNEEAIAQCKEALSARPDFAELHNSLGALLTQLDRLAEGRTYLEQALRLDPNHTDAQLNMALNLMKEKRLPESLAHFELFVKKQPNDPAIHLQMGILYENTGAWDKAANSYREALRIQPDNEQSQSSLAWVLATSPQDEIRNGQEALRLAEASCRISKKYAYLLDTLAAALAEAGRFPEAVKAGEEALALAREANDPQAEDMGKRVSLYKNNKPYRSEMTATTTPAALPQ